MNNFSLTARAALLTLFGLTACDGGSSSSSTYTPSKPNVNEKVFAECQNRQRMDNIINFWKDAGVIDSLDGNVLVIDENRWEYVEYKNKVSIGLAAYCLTANYQGVGEVFVYGKYDGEIKASVHNGDYLN